MTQKAQDPNYNYQPFCEQIARDAGKIFLKYYRAGITGDAKGTGMGTGMGTKIKADKTVVTKADLEINALVIERIAEEFPTHRVLGEEESSVKLDSEYIWVCDPVDGTFPFSIHVPVSVFSLALTHNGDVIAAVIFDVHSDRLFFAQKGKGALLDGVRIFVSKKSFDENPCVALDDSRWDGPDFAMLREYLRKQKCINFHFACISMAGTLVSRGAIDALVFTGVNCWDAAGYALIVAEAGGKVTDLACNSQRYDRPINGCIASNGVLHDKLVEIVNEDLSK